MATAQTSNPGLMHDVDFLPIEYRQKHARRQSQPWQIFVALAILGLVSVAVVAQKYRRNALERDLATIAPAYDSAMNQQKQLAELQQECQTAKACADLYTYLEHPWPRTQLLSALLTPLPESITLQQVKITREPGPAGTSAFFASATDQKTEEEKQKTLSPAQRDLKTVADAIDRMQTAIVVTGEATDVAALYHYIGELDAAPIFDKVELDSVSSIGDRKEGEGLQFRAVLIAQPGYGQLGGPTGEPQKKE